MGISMAELSIKSKEGTYPITMEASVPKVAKKFKDRMRQGERLRSRNEAKRAKIIQCQGRTPLPYCISVVSRNRVFLFS